MTATEKDELDSVLDKFLELKMDDFVAEIQRAELAVTGSIGPLDSVREYYVRVVDSPDHEWPSVSLMYRDAAIHQVTVRSSREGQVMEIISALIAKQESQFA